MGPDGIGGEAEINLSTMGVMNFKNGDKNVQLSPDMDIVIEHGTSGIWTYKKWASGEADLRATFVTTTAYAIATAYGNVYRYNAPFNIAFSGVPFSFVDYDTDSEVFVTIKGDGMDFSGGARLSSGNSLTFFWMNPTSYTAEAGAKIQIIIKGRWK